MQLYIHLPPLISWLLADMQTAISYAIANQQGQLQEGTARLEDMPASESTTLILNAADSSFFYKKLPKLSAQQRQESLSSVLEEDLIKEPGSYLCSPKPDKEGIYTIVALTTPAAWRSIQQWASQRPEKVKMVLQMLLLPPASLYIETVQNTLVDASHNYVLAYRDAAGKVGSSMVTTDNFEVMANLFVNKLQAYSDVPRTEMQGWHVRATTPTYPQLPLFQERYQEQHWTDWITAAKHNTLSFGVGVSAKDKAGNFLSELSLPASHLIKTLIAILLLWVMYFAGMALQIKRLSNEESLAKQQQMVLLERVFPGVQLNGEPLSEMLRLTTSHRKSLLTDVPDKALLDIRSIENIVASVKSSTNPVIAFSYDINNGAVLEWKTAILPEPSKNLENAFKEAGFSVTSVDKRWRLKR